MAATDWSNKSEITEILFQLEESFEVVPAYGKVGPDIESTKFILNEN